MTDARIVVSNDDPVFDVADSDQSVSPAEDFYRFVNGGWLDSNPVPAEYGAWGAIQEVHERNQGILRGLLEAASADESAAAGTAAHWAGTYYRTGMDTDTIESLGTSPIEPWLARVDALATTPDVVALVTDMHRQGFGALFGTGVIPDFEDATVNLLYLGQGGLGLPDRDYYLRDDETSTQLLGEYQNHMARMFVLLGQDENGADEAAASVIAIETAIAESSYTNVQLRDVDLITNKYATADLNTLMPNFGLQEYVIAIGAGNETSVNIDNEGFYPAIDAMLDERAIEDWRHYLRWHIVSSVASSLPRAFDEESFDFYGRKLGGQQEQKVRWKRVLAAGSSDIGQLISQLYVRDNFTAEAKADVERLVDNLFVSMGEAIDRISWMSETTKNQARQKLKGFGYKIGYPDEWRDYSELVLVEGRWLESRLAARRFEINRQMAQLGQPVDPHEWSMAPHVVNAYYHPLRNEVVFPAGILQDPFFDATADDAINYGAIGAVIGHEITHGFDDSGSRFDADGNVRDWWTPEDREEFDARAQVMVDQFNAFEIEDGLSVNGELTLGENIADLGGLKIALAALHAATDGEPQKVAGLTPEQRFFMSWARVWRKNYTDEYLRLQVNSDPHAPSNLRCSAPMSNLASFADAFGIPQDADTMRPQTERVDIW
ncbi:MAG: M13 family metallopeptidase [Acidimicrobiia bacterium]